jgi:3-methylfumaryl-CoA hydratase
MVDLADWIGKTETASDTMSPSVLTRLSATLDYPDNPWRDGQAPLLAHWLHFLPDAAQSSLSADGHPQRGGFLPPVALPRRMWAGGRLTFSGPVPVGSPMERTSTIISVKEKSGASGQLVFVTVRHDIAAAGQLAISEEQDLVYREDAKAPAPAMIAAIAKPRAEPRHSDVTRAVMADPTLLFRFSALTFNAHRIHYDRDYARDVEGYAGLVVHGPLLATLLLDHFRRAAPHKAVTRFAFRAQKPLIDTAPFTLCLAWHDGGADLWTLDAAGDVTMSAEIDAL